MAKKPKHPTIYDFELDAVRPATQEDVDALVAHTQRLGSLRHDLVKLMASYFPRLAEDLDLGSERRGQLNAEFYRANGRHPKDMAEARLGKVTH